MSALVFPQNSISGIQIDKAVYNPGDTVKMTLTFANDASGMKLSLIYYHLSSVIARDTISLAGGTQYNAAFIPPMNDYQGYLVQATLLSQNASIDSATIGLDVSSTWKRFPRYGFLSNYGSLASSDISGIIDNLNRYHINGLQFYDWQYKHHQPLKGEPGNIAPYWNDIANRTNYLSTVQKYLSAAHARGMKTMAYNLLYGAYANASTDGVDNSWRIFKDQGHQTPDFYSLPSTWASNIYVMDPTNPAWVSYIDSAMQKVFLGLAFDGWHVDQLGDQGTCYNYSGKNIGMTAGFQSFLTQSKDFLKVPLVCNAVNQYAQVNIALTDVDFLYSEVWTPNDKYSDLVNILSNNSQYGNYPHATVLAAYVNRGLSTSSNYFNTSSVLFTDAVIFAAGGSHIELGEHMLGNEYFPNSNLKMRPALSTALPKYYDFLTAYENILRDSLSGISIAVIGDSIPTVTWPPRAGYVWLFPRVKKNLFILHAINFTLATTMNWRDDTGTQSEPSKMQNIRLFIPLTKQIKNAWYASPDNASLAPQAVQYTQDNSGITVTLPSLKYWSTLVLEFNDNVLDIKSQTINENHCALNKTILIPLTHRQKLNTRSLLMQK